ncbi:MAG: hypothetical protein KAH46_18190 [Mycobacterium sp.]|nr:hypothetical protein [Mycobacterium sp.]
MSVSEAWTDLLALLHEEAPRTAASLLPPPPPDTVASAEASTGLDWPRELIEYFSLHDGCDEGADLPGQVLPAQDLFGVEAALVERAMMIEVWQGLADADPVLYAGGYDALPVEYPEAGQSALAFLPQYIPVSGSDGYLYFCDLRPGPRHGCIRSYDKYEADDGEPTWESITAMLVDLRQRIENRTSVDGWEPRVVDGRIDWLPEGTHDAAPPPTPLEPVVIHTGYDSPEVSLSDHEPDDPGADTHSMSRAVMDSAAATYGAERVTDAQTIIPWIPDAPGFVAGCVATVDGAPIYFAAVVTDTPGEFLVYEVPPQGLRFER